MFVTSQRVEIQSKHFVKCRASRRSKGLTPLADSIGDTKQWTGEFCKPLSELIDSLPGVLHCFVFLSPTTVTAFCLDEVRTDMLFIRQQEVAVFQPQFAKFKSSKKFWRLSLEKNFRLYSIKTKQTTVDLRFGMKVQRSQERVTSFEWEKFPVNII